jgi:hypothetical protein
MNLDPINIAAAAFVFLCMIGIGWVIFTIWPLRSPPMDNAEPPTLRRIGDGGWFRRDARGRVVESGPAEVYEDGHRIRILTLPPYPPIEGSNHERHSENEGAGNTNRSDMPVDPDPGAAGRG